MNQHNYCPPCTADQLREMYETRAMTLIEIARVLGVSQKRVATAIRKYGIAMRRQIPRDQTGPRNACWKGLAAGYQAMHLRVYQARGAPMVCEECGTTTAKIYDWASMTRRYEDPSDYRRLCRSCHWTHDGTIQNIKKMRRA